MEASALKAGDLLVHGVPLFWKSLDKKQPKYITVKAGDILLCVESREIYIGRYFGDTEFGKEQYVIFLYQSSLIFSSWKCDEDIQYLAKL